MDETLGWCSSIREGSLVGTAVGSAVLSLTPPGRRLVGILVFMRRCSVPRLRLRSVTVARMVTPVAVIALPVRPSLRWPEVLVPQSPLMRLQEVARSLSAWWVRLRPVRLVLTESYLAVILVTSAPRVSWWVLLLVKNVRRVRLPTPWTPLKKLTLQEDTVRPVVQMRERCGQLGRTVLTEECDRAVDVRVLIAGKSLVCDIWQSVCRCLILSTDRCRL